MKNTQETGYQARKQTRRTGAPSGPRKAEERRAALIDAASRLFVEKGYSHTTMEEIASAASFAKGTLYHYFANKEELLKALRGDFERKVMARIRPAVESCGEDDWIGRLKAWIHSAVDAYFEMHELHDTVIYGSGMPFRNAMADAEITRYLQSLISEGAQAGAWDAGDSHWTAVVMFYSFRGGCDEAILGAQPAERIPEKLFDLFCRILGIRD
ncbi:TetR/AcrR family transcriptional regulator [Limisalsivibrio acetivorans]|uniref:TetR/AcrR family transcriptional regulator n=1 Tax=Limisalsivibrio acetivorans TaxID=1304888 RepID=UPI0003B3CFBA|nr:TetR/AcrR family transcriptional regulator [Limisalsivibrio acetivorans]